MQLVSGRIRREGTGLKPEQWHRVKALTATLLDLSRGEREPYLQNNCDDPIVRAEARSLLSEYERHEFDDFPEVGRFIPRRKLGSGGFGAVYEAYDSDQQIVLALKVLTQKDPASLDRFKREFWVLRELDHPNLIKLYQLFQDDDCWFFTMQLVRGSGFLEHVTEPVRPGGVNPLRPALLQLCRGVHALHRAGKIHRDLKPDNVLVNHEGTVILIDLGMARELGPGPIQQSVAIIGSPHYLSPEQGCGGSLTEATDWYSVGVILFEALTGSYPFDGEIADIIQRKLSTPAPEPVEVRPGIPEDLNTLCSDLLQRDPQLRPVGTDILRRLGEIPTESKRFAPGPNRQVFVGREDLLGRLSELFTTTQHSNACILANIRGTSGIGKSTLIREFQQRLVNEWPGVVVLAARCHESARVRFKALDILIDKLAAYLKTLLPMEVKALLPRDVPSLVRLFPAMKQVETIARVRLGGSPMVDSQELREWAFEALMDLLGRLGAMKPLVISIDDLQWGDKDSVAFFRHILMDNSPVRLLMLTSHRSEDADSSPFLQAYNALLHESRPTANVEVVDLEVGKLSSQEAFQLARRLLPRGLEGDGRTLASIVGESGHIPFLIAEFTRYAAVCIEREHEPHFTIDEVIRQRIAILPAAAKQLLNIVAIAGQPVGETAACKAARLEADDFPGLQSLVAESLARVRETPEGRELETYHDRYREVVLNALVPELRQEAHLGLATALAELPAPDPAFVATHFRLAGQNEQAAKYFLAAAQNASAAYAFDQASEFYRLALNLGAFPIDEHLHLARLHGEALVQAGRGRDAAEVFRRAAEKAQSMEQLDFQRRAAEQLLRTGDLNEGLILVQAVARTLGIWLGDKPWQTILSLAWRRSIIFLVGSRFRVRPQEEISLRDLAILDTYWSLAVGLSLVDMIRAYDFSTRHFLLAIRVGEPQRIALSLALEAGHSMIQRNRNRERVDRSLRCAKELAQRCGQRHVLGIVEGMETVCGFLVGEWRRAYECGVRSEQILREECSGVRWEIVSICIFSLKCLSMMGDWKRHADRLLPLLREARTKGDRYAVTGLLLLTHSHTLDLVEDDPVAARRRISEALSEWSQAGFHLQDFWALYGEVETDLYEGLSRQALDRVTRSWATLERSLLLKGQVVHIVALHLLARSLLAVAVDHRLKDPDVASDYVQRAAKIAKKIQGEQIPWGVSLGKLILASTRAHDDALNEASELLIAAEHAFLAVEMNQYRAAAQWCRGHLIGGAAGINLRRTAEAWMVSQGAKNPKQMLRLLAPGEWERFSVDNQ